MSPVIEIGNSELGIFKFVNFVSNFGIPNSYFMKVQKLDVEKRMDVLGLINYKFHMGSILADKSQNAMKFTNEDKNTVKKFDAIKNASEKVKEQKKLDDKADTGERTSKIPENINDYVDPKTLLSFFEAPMNMQYYLEQKGPTCAAASVAGCWNILWHRKLSKVLDECDAAIPPTPPSTTTVTATSALVSSPVSPPSPLPFTISPSLGNQCILDVYIGFMEEHIRCIRTKLSRVMGYIDTRGEQASRWKRENSPRLSCLSLYACLKIGSDAYVYPITHTEATACTHTHTHTRPYTYLNK